MQFHIVAKISSYTLRSIVHTANKEIRHCVKRSLADVKNEGKLLQCQSRKVAAVTYRRWSFTSGFWMGKLWCFGKLRWSLTRGDCEWRFDCIFSSLRSKRSVWFRNKGIQERPRNGIFGFGRARNGARAKKNERGGRGRERILSSPPPPLVFYWRHFSRGLRLSFLVFCSETARRSLLCRLYFFRCHFYCPTCPSSRPPYIFLSKFQVGLVMQGLGLKKKGGLILW